MTIDPQHKNEYVADPEDMKEMARLIRQDRAWSFVMPEVFSKQVWKAFREVLDIGCGPGGWCLDMASRFPKTNFTGIDVSNRMLQYADLLAMAESRENVTFKLMDATNPLDFPDSSFDLVNGRLMNAFLTTEKWPGVLREASRILRPGGRIFLMDLEASYGNSAAFEKASALLTQAGTAVGRSFSPTGRSSGISPVLKGLLRNAGFSAVQHQIMGLEISHEQPEEFALWQENTILMSETFMPFVLHSGVVTEEELSELHRQMIEDMNRPDFSSMTFMMVAWATK
jgi:ubiquinone/menaquinone biosynthesis C-methylase UbiE